MTTESTTTVLPTCEDGWVLHFLKELPVPVWIFIFTSMFMASWVLWQPDFIPRLIDGLVGALLLSLRLGSVKPNTTSITTDSVNAENIDTANTEQGDIIGNPASTLTKDK
jgi:hypothetical protein